MSIAFSSATKYIKNHFYIYITLSIINLVVRNYNIKHFYLPTIRVKVFELHKPGKKSNSNALFPCPLPSPPFPTPPPRPQRIRIKE